MYIIENALREMPQKKLVLTDNLFHEALAMKPESRERIRVENPNGEDFDIVYLDNDRDLEPYDKYPEYVKPPYMADYALYDENDRETLYLDFFDGLKDVVCEELNEYTIVLTKVILNFTDLNVHWTDDRILWFVKEQPRLHICNELPELCDDTAFIIQKQFEPGLYTGFRRMSSTYAMHNVFVCQWILGGKHKDQYIFLEGNQNESGGIGAVLAYYKRFSVAAQKLGFRYISGNREKFGKFRISMLEKYFNVSLFDDAANEENTVSIPNHVMFVKTRLVYSIVQTVNTDILSDSFKEHMDEYFDTVFEGERPLGVLIRGSDYISSGLSGDRLMATPDQMIPEIRQWMNDYGYTKLFLATEDRDILKRMREEFGKQIVAVAQERIGVSDLRKGQIISELEKERAKGTEYDEKLEDATVNYFYALYLLSRCDAFICSGQCNGWDVVTSFNNGRFERTHKFAVGMAE